MIETLALLKEAKPRGGSAGRTSVAMAYYAAEAILQGAGNPGDEDYVDAVLMAHCGPSFADALEIQKTPDNVERKPLADLLKPEPPKPRTVGELQRASWFVIEYGVATGEGAGRALSSIQAELEEATGRDWSCIHEWEDARWDEYDEYLAGLDAAVD